MDLLRAVLLRDLGPVSREAQRPGFGRLVDGEGESTVNMVLRLILYHGEFTFNRPTMDILCAEFKELGIDKEDCDVVLLCHDNQLLCKLENIMKRFLLLAPDSTLRSPTDSLLAEALLQAGENCLKCLRKSEHSKEQFSFVASLLQMSTSLLKMLRNSFAGNMMADTNSKRLGCFLSALNEILGDVLSCSGIFKREDVENSILSRCCLQVVANFATSSSSNSKESLRMFSGNLLDFVCSEVKDQKSKVYATAALHACLVHSDDALSDLKLHIPTCDVVLLTRKLLSTLVHDEERMESEWSLFVFKRLLRSSNYLQDVWESMTVKESIFIVEVLASECESLVDRSTESKHSLASVCHRSNLDFLCLQLSDRMASFVRGEGRVTDAENCTHLLLDFLSQTSSCFQSLTGMKNTTSLLRESIDLLNILQSASKHKDGLAKEEAILLSEIKRDLVRLISNLVYKNKEHQDLMRESGGFSLILNMTTIDPNCPTIQQWALFTINNLCEDNEENRKFISDLKLERVADVSQELKKAGVKVEVKDGKLHFLKPDE